MCFRSYHSARDLQQLVAEKTVSLGRVAIQQCPDAYGDAVLVLVLHY
jgi:hypothetical protein